MASTIFANSNEVACKASDGKSTAAFPDACFSPPSPPVGPIPLPYPNTAEDKDIDKGTAKVFIKDGMVSMQDSSCLKTSTGNEAATQNYAKGLLTNAIQGKAYFQIWSMDVQVEGEGVARHLDLMSHNHASMQGNTMGVHTSSTGQGTVAEGQKTAPVKMLDIALDLKRDKTGKYYHSTGFEADDTKKFDEDKLDQYVNFENLTADEITFFDTDHSSTNRNLLKDMDDHCQLGRKLDFRVRFKKQEVTQFNLKVQKIKVGLNFPNRAPSTQDNYIYSPAEQSRGKDFFKYSIPGKTGITAVSAETNDISTNANGQKEFSITLDASYASYIVTVEAKTSEGKRVRASLWIEAKRMLFYNIFLEREVALEERHNEIAALESAAKTNITSIENQKISFLNKQRWQVMDQQRLQNDHNKVKNELSENQKQLAEVKRPKQMTRQVLEKKKFAPFAELTDQNKRIGSEWLTTHSLLETANEDLVDTTEQIATFDRQIKKIEDKYNADCTTLLTSYKAATFIPKKIQDSITSVATSYAAVGITLIPCRRFYFNEEDIDDGRYRNESATQNGGSAGSSRYLEDISKIIRQPVHNKDYPCLIDFLFKGSLLSCVDGDDEFAKVTIKAHIPGNDPHADPATGAPTQHSSRESRSLIAEGVIIKPINSRTSLPNQAGVTRSLDGLSSVVEAKLIRDNISIQLTDKNFALVAVVIMRANPTKPVSAFRVVFPQSQLAALFPGQPVPAGEFTVRLKVKFRYALRLGGFSMRKPFRAIISQVYDHDLPQNPRPATYWVRIRTIDVEELKCILAHELGHRLGLVPMGSSDVFILDKPTSVYYDEKLCPEHVGPHCKYGSTYAPKLKKWTTNGTCIMFGATNGTVFCSECGLALEKTNCSIKLPGKYE